MPNITMCVNHECNRRETCYRYTAEPHPTWQSYADFSCRVEKPYTDMYWEVEPPVPCIDTQNKEIQ